MACVSKDLCKQGLLGEINALHYLCSSLAYKKMFVGFLAVQGWFSCSVSGYLLHFAWLVNGKQFTGSNRLWKDEKKTTKYLLLYIVIKIPLFSMSPSRYRCYWGQRIGSGALEYQLECINGSIDATMLGKFLKIMLTAVELIHSQCVF